MKKTQTTLLISVLLIVAMMMTACAGGGTDAATGTWKLTSGEAQGITVSLDQLSQLGVNADMTMEFKGGKFTANFNGEQGSGSYKIDGDTITMSENGQEMTGTISGNEIKIDAGGATLIFTKQ
ncbi:MAG: lipocalin family protein [Christensenellales bacterium]|jgi:major membrane immunogen (membrane-anchored lipoprotein)